MACPRYPRRALVPGREAGTRASRVNVAASRDRPGLQPPAPGGGRAAAGGRAGWTLAGRRRVPEAGRSLARRCGVPAGRAAKPGVPANAGPGDAETRERGDMGARASRTEHSPGMVVGKRRGCESGCDRTWRGAARKSVRASALHPSRAPWASSLGRRHGDEFTRSSRPRIVRTRGVHRLWITFATSTPTAPVGGVRCRDAVRWQVVERGIGVGHGAVRCHGA
jgi:hypothetical protein